MFTDLVTLTLSAGRGGNGIVSWRREKYLPKGGPDGGNGGRGGSIILKASKDIHSLQHLRNLRKIKSKNGMPGGSSHCTGKSGEDKEILLPLGTLVKDAISKEILFDLVEDGQIATICTGGRGGRGNASFRSSTHQAPHFATDGKPGEVKEVELELKLIADVGLVGMPNAGKSTLFTLLTDAPAKVAPYPFTTMDPNLGIIYDDGTPIFLADIPGVIKEAHINKGLGLSFLRHIERTQILLYVIDISAMEGRKPLDDFLTLRNELALYDPTLLDKPSLLVLNKIDEDPDQLEYHAFVEELPLEIEILSTSGKTKEGLPQLEEWIKKSYSTLFQKDPDPCCHG